MVRYLTFYSVLFLLFSCNEAIEPVKDDASFNASEFKLDAFTRRVHDFLNARRETKQELNYDALFVNTENCSACMRGAFEGIRPYLSKTTAKTFIYFNDSSIFQIAPKNDHLEFICLPVNEFHSKDVFHSKMYLYTVQKESIFAHVITLDVADSLNNL